MLIILIVIISCGLFGYSMNTIGMYIYIFIYIVCFSFLIFNVFNKKKGLFFKKFQKEKANLSIYFF
jgi:hypothetical protein